jgi:hypothetical protein
MVVLLLFNKVLTWTVERIQDETQIKLELLLQILSGLLKSKLLVCTDINEDEDYKETFPIEIEYFLPIKHFESIYMLP